MSMRRAGDRKRRNSLRAGGYNYATPGSYFVTICINDRKPRFGEIVDAAMRPNLAGTMIANAWQSLPSRFPDIRLDSFIIMPNHLHGIIAIELGGNGDELDPTFNSTSVSMVESRFNAVMQQAHAIGTQDGSLSRIVQAFKSITTREYIRGVREHDCEPFEGRLWQRSFYDHIIRDDRDLDRIRDYIEGNPGTWAEDRLHPNYVAPRINRDP